MLSRIRAALALGMLLSSLTVSTVAASEPQNDVVLPVPIISQYDGTVWGPSNCGPAASAMVLESFNRIVPKEELRKRANQLLGIASPDTGTRIQDLAQTVEEFGLTVNGPYDGKEIRKWTLEELRQEIREGRPVVVQTRLRLLPNHLGVNTTADHYVAIVGLEGDGFLYNDSAFKNGTGETLTMSSAELSRAWGGSKFPFAAFSVGPEESEKAPPSGDFPSE
jgi:uncharacterized protein YvpB